VAGERCAEPEMRGQVEDGIQQTRERIAGNSMRVNVFLGYHSNRDSKWLEIPSDTRAKKRAGGLDGRRGEGICEYETSKKTAKSKAPPSKTRGRAPKFVLRFIVRATRRNPPWWCVLNHRPRRSRSVCLWNRRGQRFRGFRGLPSLLGRRSRRRHLISHHAVSGSVNRF